MPHLARSRAEREGLAVVVTGPIQRVLQLGPGAALRLTDPFLALVIHGGVEDPPLPTHVPLPGPAAPSRNFTPLPPPPPQPRPRRAPIGAPPGRLPPRRARLPAPIGRSGEAARPPCWEGRRGGLRRPGADTA